MGDHMKLSDRAWVGVGIATFVVLLVVLIVLMFGGSFLQKAG
jgi:hypothetical protein